MLSKVSKAVSLRGALGAMALVVACGLSACVPTGTGGGGGDGDGPRFCDPGERRCECRDDGTCDDGLSCSAGRLCVDLLCSQGQRDCPCGEGDTCNDGLVCNGLVCVEDDGFNNPLPDAGGDEDAGGGEEDAGGGEDVGFEDVGFEDVGVEDAGFEDVGVEDAGFEDAGEEDAGEEDAGQEGAVLSAPSLEVFVVPTPPDETTRDIRFENAGDQALTIIRVRVDPQGGTFALVDPVPTPFVLGKGSFFEVPVITRGGYGDAEADLVVEVLELPDPVVVALEREVTNPNACPEALAVVRAPGGAPGSSAQVQVGQSVELDGFSSRDDDGSVAGYQWTLVGRPGGSTATFSPSATTASTNFVPDVPGTYAIDLQVFDDMGLASCNTARVSLTATPTPMLPDEILIELTWSTDNTDMDIHYVLESAGGLWDMAPDSVFWRNRDADWGVVGDNSDDPSLELDDTNGLGPERIRHPNPGQGTYYVGVYMYNDNGAGPTTATLSVKVAGVEQLNPLLTMDGFMNNEFWAPVRIDVSATGQVTVTDIMSMRVVGFPSTVP